jgi:thiol:disulfide interchange protein DsbC
MTSIQSSMLRASALLLAALSISSIAIAAETDEQLEKVRARITEVFEVIEPEDVSSSPVDGWYTIQKGSIIAYVSDDARYLLQGDLIDLEAQVNLSEQSRNSARRDVVATIDDGQVIKFSPAEVKHSVTIFTDIECTYCRRLHSQIDEYMSHGIEVRYLLYPRNGPASRSWNTSEDVWCASDRNHALTEAKLDRKIQSTNCDASVIKDHYALGQEVGLSGTPAILLDDGTLIGGYLPPDALNEQLNSKTPRTASR